SPSRGRAAAVCRARELAARRSDGALLSELLPLASSQHAAQTTSTSLLAERSSFWTVSPSRWRARSCWRRTPRTSSSASSSSTTSSRTSAMSSSVVSCRNSTRTTLPRRWSRAISRCCSFACRGSSETPSRSTLTTISGPPRCSASSRAAVSALKPTSVGMNPTTTAIWSPGVRSGRRPPPDRRGLARSYLPVCGSGEDRRRSGSEGARRGEGSGAALAGELLDLVHDPCVQHAPAHALGGVGVDVLELDRGADTHGDRAAVGEQPGEHVLRALEPHRDHRAAGFDGEPGGTLLSRVEQAVLGAAALGIDREAVTLAEDRQPGLQRPLAGGERLTVHRHRLDGVEEPAQDAPAQPLLRPQGVLGDETDLPRQHHWEHEAVDVGEVVGGDHEASLAGDVVEAGDPWVPQELDEGARDAAGAEVEASGH